jgi:hypothetical protein
MKGAQEEDKGAEAGCPIEGGQGSPEQFLTQGLHVTKAAFQESDGFGEELPGPVSVLSVNGDAVGMGGRRELLRDGLSRCAGKDREEELRLVLQ